MEANGSNYPFEYLSQLNMAHNQIFLLRGFTHTFRNPINSILLASELLQRYIEDVSSQFDGLADEPDELSGWFRETGGKIQTTMPQIVRNVSSAAIRLNQLVMHLSEMIGRGAVAAQPHVDIYQLVTLCHQLLQHQIRERTQHFNLDCADNLPLLPGNGQQLLQAILNLVMNALLALPDRSCGLEFVVFHNQELQQIELIIADQGCGIAPATLPHVLAPFFTTWAEKGCVGLGLTVASQIIKEHGGRLMIDSKLDAGTTVWVTFPCLSVANCFCGIGN